MRALEAALGVRLETTEMSGWRLTRSTSGFVPGFAYFGVAKAIFDTPLNRAITVIGFNHNIQSSFGVTREVRRSITNWITTKAINAGV